MLLEWLTSYLVRHGYEDKDALEAVQASRPAASRPPKAKKTKLTEIAPFTEIEATVEMTAVPPLNPATEPTVEASAELSGEEQGAVSTPARTKKARSSSKAKATKSKGSSKRKK